MGLWMKCWFSWILETQKMTMNIIEQRSGGMNSCQTNAITIENTSIMYTLGMIPLYCNLNIYIYIYYYISLCNLIPIK